MRVLQVGYTDLVGTRFNGRDLCRGLRERGVEAQHCVWVKESDDPGTWQLSGNRYRSLVNDLVFKSLERRLSVESLLFPYAWKLAFDRRFRAADIVHYHLIHRDFFSLPSLPVLTRMRPSVWTLHDPWAMTGHCLYPLGCGRWETGCGECPQLDSPVPMRVDRTAFMWKAKRRIYEASRIDVVVASRWMYDMASRSPLLASARLHHIPFGIDLEVFRPGDPEAAKRSLGVMPGSVVICFRAVASEFKGLRYIMETLRRLRAERPVCLLTFNERGLVDEFRGRFQIVELGWVNDESLVAEAYNAADVFLMPSTAEAFGMMAIEAMACGKPVVAFDGTSLPGVLFAPEGGMMVPQGDVTALTAALERLLRDGSERSRLGQRALAIARAHYDVRDHVDRVLELYRDVLSRRGAMDGGTSDGSRGKR